MPFLAKGQFFLLEEPTGYDRPTKSIMLEKQKQPYKIKGAVVPTAFAFAAGLCPDTDGGRFLRQGFLFGATVTIGYGEKKPLGHYLITTGVGAVGFLAGRGVREIYEK